eukprot:3402444-Amphidinium_carterae.1
MEAVLPVAGLVKLHSPNFNPNFFSLLCEGVFDDLFGTTDVLAHLSHGEGYLVVELRAAGFGLE